MILAGLGEFSPGGSSECPTDIHTPPREVASNQLNPRLNLSTFHQNGITFQISLARSPELMAVSAIETLLTGKNLTVFPYIQKISNLLAHQKGDSLELGSMRSVLQ